MRFKKKNQFGERIGWAAGDVANLCIGQGEITVTPLQMAVMTSAVANGGKVLQPRLVNRIDSQRAFDQAQNRVIPVKVLRRLAVEAGDRCSDSQGDVGRRGGSRRERARCACARLGHLWEDRHGAEESAHREISSPERRAPVPHGPHHLVCVVCASRVAALRHGGDGGERRVGRQDLCADRREDLPCDSGLWNANGRKQSQAWPSADGHGTAPYS